jgi:hypothetical protein
VSYTAYSSKGFDLILQEDELTPSPHNGGWLAWLGSYYDEDASITQSVTVPSGSSYLRYWYFSASDNIAFASSAVAYPQLPLVDLKIRELSLKKD